MRTLAIIALCLPLTACGTMGLGELTQHLNERGCATKGSAHASAGITGASLAGDLSWNCGHNAAPAQPAADPAL